MSLRSGILGARQSGTAKAASGDYSNHTYKVEKDPGREAHESCPNPAFIFFLNFFCNLFLLSRTPEGLAVFLFTGGAANSSSWFSLFLPLWHFISSSQ